MKKQYWITLFFLFLFIDLLAIYFDSPLFQYIAKPLLVLTLLAYFIGSVDIKKGGLARWIVTALAFSWVGDILLMVDKGSQGFFIAGLVAFLIAHFFYITFFSTVQREEKIRPKPLLGVIVVVWYILLMKMIKPDELGSLMIPVRVYGAVIMIMLWMAMQMLYGKNRTAGILMVTGAALFAVSDSVLAVDKFAGRVKFAGVIIMLTYGLAQYLLTAGAIRKINMAKTE